MKPRNVTIGHRCPNLSTIISTSLLPHILSELPTNIILGRSDKCKSKWRHKDINYTVTVNSAITSVKIKSSTVNESEI